MSRIQYNPFFTTEFPFRLLVPESGAAAAATAKTWTPAVDIRETENALILKADLPDVNENEIDLRIDDGTLVLKGERKVDPQQPGKSLRVERSHGAFARSFTLPDTVDGENVKAEYKAGVLTVTLGKKEVAKPKQIKVAIQ
jgi:HSP20 family protein